MAEPGGPEDRDPPFLKLLDSDRKRAWTEFYLFFMKAMSARLPRKVHLFRRDQHEDLLGDLLVAFTDNDFARLRKYRDQGTPFVGWLYYVANNWLIEEYRRRRRINWVSLDENPGVASNLRSDPVPSPSMTPALIVAIRVAVGRLDAYCRALLGAAILDGLKPREIALILGRPKNDNKTISDKISSCKDSLCRRLRDEGYDERAIRRCMDP